jgi:hypothetical protein
VLATLSVVLVGLHLALNWEWIARLVRARLLVRRGSSAGEVTEQEIAELGGRRIGNAEFRDGTMSLVMKALGLQDLAAIGRRLGVLALAVVVIWASCFALIEATASKTILDSRDGSLGTSAASDAPSPQTNGQLPLRGRVWSAPDLAALPQEVGTQLLIIGVAAVGGKLLLRLRL